MLVNSFECDAMRKIESDCIGVSRSTSAWPYALDQTTSWSCTTPMTRPGRPMSFICAWIQASISLICEATSGWSARSWPAAEALQRQATTAMSDISCFITPLPTSKN